MMGFAHFATGAAVGRLVGHSYTKFSEDPDNIKWLLKKRVMWFITAGFIFAAFGWALISHFPIDHVPHSEYQQYIFPVALALGCLDALTFVYACYISFYGEKYFHPTYYKILGWCTFAGAIGAAVPDGLLVFSRFTGYHQYYLDRFLAFHHWAHAVPFSGGLLVQLVVWLVCMVFLAFS